jgi:hypothetical protein
VTAPDPVLYWLEDGKFARAMRVGSGPNNSSLLVVDLTTGDGPSVIGKPGWFAAGYVAAYGGLVPECADEGTEPGQWSYGVAKLPETPPADPEREQRIAAWRNKVWVNDTSIGGKFRWDADSDRAWAMSGATLREGIDLMKSAPPAPAASSELLAAAEYVVAAFEGCQSFGETARLMVPLRAAIAAEKARREEKPCP